MVDKMMDDLMSKYAAASESRSSASLLLKNPASPIVFPRMDSCKGDASESKFAPLKLSLNDEAEDATTKNKLIMKIKTSVGEKVKKSPVKKPRKQQQQQQQQQLADQINAIIDEKLEISTRKEVLEVTESLKPITVSFDDSDENENDAKSQTNNNNTINEEAAFQEVRFDKKFNFEVILSLKALRIFPCKNKSNSMTG